MRPQHDDSGRSVLDTLGMTIGTSLVLIAIGAILKYAVTADLAGIDLQVVGVILMVTGGVGLLIVLALLARDRYARVPPPPDGRYP